MAYCPHCDQDRSIKRQSVGSFCRYCFASDLADNPVRHEAGCRGPTTGWVDVCAYCDTALFASARTRGEFESSERHEHEQRTSRQEKEKRAKKADDSEQAATSHLVGLQLGVCVVVMPLAGIAIAWFAHEGFWSVLNALFAYAVIYVFAFFPVWFGFEYLIARRRKRIDGES